MPGIRTPLLFYKLSLLLVQGASAALLSSDTTTEDIAKIPLQRVIWGLLQTLNFVEVNLLHVTALDISDTSEIKIKIKTLLICRDLTVMLSCV